jgi:hypothetical protein
MLNFSILSHSWPALPFLSRGVCGPLLSPQAVAQPHSHHKTPKICPFPCPIAHPYSLLGELCLALFFSSG